VENEGKVQGFEDESKILMGKCGKIREKLLEFFQRNRGKFTET
jgi:hypothetical protein